MLVFINDAEAVVESGALINQDPSWHDDAINPHSNQAAEQSDLKGEEVVSVEATNYMQTINMTGIFSLPGFNFDPTDDTKFKDRLTLPSAFGAGGDKTGGMGGAFFITVQDNTTHAVVEDGAQIYSGADGGFNMKAEEAIFAINLTQAGASSGKLAIAGSVAYVGLTSDTLAQLGSGAVVTGRDARIYAGDLESQINWVGGIAKGDNVGVGIAVAINNFDRKTRAVIGDPDTRDSTGSIASTSSIDVTDNVNVHALVDGELWAFTVAGAASTGSEPDPGPMGGGSAFADDDPLDGQSLPALFGEDVAPELSKQKTGIGIAAAVAINVVTDNTQASIVDAGELSAGGDVLVTAESKLAHRAITGGAAFAKPGAGQQSSNALAGALSFNNLDIGTRAFLLDTTITADGLTVSAGAAVTASDKGNTIAGSVSVNRLVNATKAYLDDATINVGGDGTITALDEFDHHCRRRRARGGRRHRRRVLDRLQRDHRRHAGFDQGFRPSASVGPCR